MIKVVQKPEFRNQRNGPSRHASITLFGKVFPGNIDVVYLVSAKMILKISSEFQTDGTRL
jgi:hypothetical protein